MTEKVLIVLSCGTDNPNRSTRALFLAMVAKKAGKDTALFLLDEAVHIAKKGVADKLQAATGDKGDDHLSYLQEFEVPIHVCTPCAISRGIKEDELVEGARFSSGDMLISLACESTVISL
jgi:predicted peroxiredoxin